MKQQSNEVVELNQDWQTRLSLIIDHIDPHQRSKNGWEDTGSIGVLELPLSVAEALLDQEFVDPEERQPDGLSAIEIINFMRKWQGFGPKAVGYAVGHLRPDYRITLTGVVIRDIPQTSNTPQIPITQRLRDAFRKAFEHLTYCEVTPHRLYSDQD